MSSARLPASGRPATALFIFITIAIDAIGLGIVIPVLPEVVRKFISGEADVSRIYGYFIAIYALFQFMSSPFLGRLSDRFGRRPILLLSLLGAGVDYIFMAFAPTLPHLFIGRIISGISGASYTVATAYMADISDDSNRSKNFGLIGAAFGLGFIVGPAVGGMLATYGLQAPFLAAAAFNLLNFFFGFFVLPESLAEKNRRSLDWKALNPFRALNALRTMPTISTLVLAFTLIQLASQTHPSLWTLYTEHRYAWTPAQVGISLTVMGVLSAISQGALTAPLVRYFGERKLVKYGCICEALAFIAFGLASTGTLLYVVLIVSSLFWASHPALQSLIAKEIRPEEQGELQGALMSLTSLTSIINPLIVTTIFAKTTQPGEGLYLPGSPYLLASVLFVVAWMAFRSWEKRHTHI
jgi:DHA1 family tetracycline resistance protein-like MFS transporter